MFLTSGSPVRSERTADVNGQAAQLFELSGLTRHAALAADEQTARPSSPTSPPKFRAVTDLHHLHD
ncbi:MAG: hypothetical protein ACRD9R_00965 [Pyrinomonadaceae bacterium]